MKLMIARGRSTGLKAAVAVLMMFLTSFSRGQSSQLYFDAADTSRFIASNSTGWHLYNSYVGRLPHDSVVAEFVLQHANNLNWSLEQYIGQLKFDSAYSKRQPIQSVFKINQLAFSLRIAIGGAVFLKLIAGAPPSSDTIVLPIRLVYWLPDFKR